MISDADIQRISDELEIEDCLFTIADAITKLTTLGQRFNLRYKSKNQGRSWAATINVKPFAAKIKTKARAIIDDDSIERAENGEVIYVHSDDCGGFCDYACNPVGDKQAAQMNDDDVAFTSKLPSAGDCW